MALTTQDLKKLWARSGNTCSFPGCGVELAPEKRVNKLTGEEAHIKGEKPTAPRYDPNQSDAERESYENRILLCPNHHTEIDADPNTWTVERLLQIKANHEQQIINNRRYPKLVGDLERLVQEYKVPIESLDLSAPEIAEGSGKPTVIRVDASVEGGTSTKIRVRPGQRIVFFARGLISFDGRHTFASPEGILCNELGLPLYVNEEGNMRGPIVFPHPDAYKTDAGKTGLVGSLFGWINAYSEDKAFFIGSKREIEISEEGILYLAVNDARGTYADNDGEFRVDMQIAGV